MKVFAERLTELRKQYKYTQRQMADILGISQPSYIRYENDTSEPTQENLVKIADAFDYQPAFLHTLRKRHFRTHAGKSCQDSGRFRRQRGLSARTVGCLNVRLRDKSPPRPHLFRSYTRIKQHSLGVCGVFRRASNKLFVSGAMCWLPLLPFGLSSPVSERASLLLKCGTNFPFFEKSLCLALT